MRKTILPIIILSLLFGVMGFAQEAELPDPGLTPDSPFYFLDTLGEKIGMFFAFGAEKKAEKALKYAEEKLAEVKVMAEKNKTKTLGKANQKYEEFLGLANKKTKEAKEEGKDVEELAILITEKTLKHQEILLEVFEKVPEEAKTAIEKAIEVSRRGSEEAVQVVTGAKKEELQKKGEEIKVKVEEIECIREGETYMPGGDKQCCAGLKRMTVTYGDGIICTLPMGYVCTAFCGDRNCEGEYENACSCPEDCFPVPNTPMMLDIDVSTTAGKPYTIGWRNVSGATSYILERDTNSSFSNPIIVSSRTLNSFSGTLSPSVSTTYYFRVKACNKYGCSSWSKTTELWVEVCPLPEAPVLTDPGISVNKHEPFTLNWTSVSGAKWYALQRGTSTDFPIGPWICEVNSDTDNPGVGTSLPEVTTTYYYRVKACNYCGCGSWSNIVDMRVIVPSITVISPNGGEAFHYGEYFIRKARVDSRKSGELIYYLVNPSGNKILIDKENTSPSKDGQFYIMGSKLIERSPLLPAGTSYKAFVTFVSDDGLEKFEDYSDNFFSITEAASTLSALALVSPNGGETWETGKTYRIKWDSIGGNDFIRIYIVDDSILGSGSTNYIIPDNGSVPVEQGYYDWTIDKKILPAGKGNNYKIRIDGVYNSSISDKSDAPFSILP